jgi:O-antigen/teichoic acid export membrane protein
LSTAQAGEPTRGAGLARAAITNSLQLGGALLLSWMLAFAGRLMLPRVLGQSRYGELSFIESVTVLTMSLLSGGVDTYIRRDVAARPEHASDFMRPLARLRLGTGVAMAAIFSIAFLLTEGSVERSLVAGAFGLGQVALLLGQTNASYLHAIRKVGPVSVSTVVTKVLWFVVLLTLLQVGPTLLALPVALLASEVLRNIWLRRFVRREFGPPHAAPVRAATKVLRSSLPYYLDAVNGQFTVYCLPIALGLLASSESVGLYAAASMAMSIPFLFAPLFGPVLLPIFARLYLQGDEVLWRRIRELVDTTIVVVAAAGVLLLAGANLVITVLFGEEFRSAAPTFGVMAVSMPATFLAMLLAGGCISDGRGWQSTRINIGTMIGMVGAGLLAIALVDDSEPGASAVAAALVLVTAEWITVAWLWIRRPFGALSTTTLIELGIVVVGGGVSAAGHIWSDSFEIGVWVGAGLAVLVMACELPRLRVKVADILAQRAPGIEEVTP